MRSDNLSLFILFSVELSVWEFLQSLFQYFQNLRLLSNYLRSWIYVFHEDQKTIILNDEKKHGLAFINPNKAGLFESNFIWGGSV